MISDIRYAFRSFLKDPAFTAVVVLTLALGIGANTAIFSVINAVLLRPAPVKDLERLALVWETDRNSGTTREPASVPDYLDFKERSRTFEQLAAVMAAEVNLTPLAGEPVRLAALRVTHDLLPMLGIRTVAGRGFAAEEDRPGGPVVVLISESLRSRLFGDGSGIDRTLRIDDRAAAVVGVLPDGSDFGVLQILSSAAYSRGFADRGIRTSVDLWLPLQPDPEALPRSTHPIFVLGRLAPGVDAAAAQSEMVDIASNLERAYPVNAGRGVNVEPLEDVVFGPVRPALYLLLFAVGLVLLVACVNVANLLIARNATRAHEYAIRAALGATGLRLARQLVVEAGLLSCAAGACGVAFAWIGLRALAAIAPHDVPRLSQASIDFSVLAVTLAVAVAAGCTFGLLPAVPWARRRRQAALTRGEPRSSGGRSRRRARSILVTAELGLAVVLVSGAGLLIRSFWMLQRVDPGFRTESVLKAEYQLPPARYPADFRVWPMFEEQHAFTHALLARTSALPGVVAAAVAGNHPLDPGFTNSFFIVGREAEAATWPELSIRRVTPGYFRTVGLDLVDGRSFTDADTTTGAPVALINAAAVRRFFPDRNPLGAQLGFWGVTRTVVGVVADEKFRGLTEATPPAAYTPLAQTPSATGAGVLLVRTSVPPEALATTIVRTIHEIDPALAVFGLEPLDETLSRSVGQRRFTMLLVALFAAVALLLAIVGVHGLVQYGVVQRQREIGVRMAVGASPSDVMAMFVREGLTLAAIGMAVGLAGAIALARVLSTMLFGIAPTDPATYAAIAALLAIVAQIAVVMPARRATLTDPLVALRSE